MPVLILLLLRYVTSAESSLLLQDDMAPQKVKFHSLDYKNVLHWKQHPNSAGDQQYTVQYKVYGDKQWTDAQHCQGVAALLCDLSQEMSDPREWYYARVQASSVKAQSPWVLSSRFHPQRDTSVSPPQMKLSVTERGIVVRVKPPRSPLRRQNGKWISVAKLQRLTFRIHLMHNDVEEKTHEIEGCAKTFLLEGLRRKTIYCLQAESVLPSPGRSSSARGPRTCVSTQ